MGQYVCMYVCVCVCVCVCVYIYIYIYIYTHAHRLIGIMVLVFANGLGDRDSILKKKWYWIHPSLTLSIIRNRSRVNEAIQEKE